MIKAKFKDTPLEEFVDLPLKDFSNYKINKLGQVKSVSHRRILKSSRRLSESYSLWKR